MLGFLVLILGVRNKVKGGKKGVIGSFSHWPCLKKKKIWMKPDRLSGISFAGKN
jgi:hypothetical protein